MVFQVKHYGKLEKQQINLKRLQMRYNRKDFIEQICSLVKCIYYKCKDEREFLFNTSWIGVQDITPYI